MSKRTLKEVVTADLARTPIRSQEDCCRVAARATVTMLGAPDTDRDLILAAYFGAQGLFGEAFDKASDGQRWIWTDMYEVALREAVEAMRT